MSSRRSAYLRADGEQVESALLLNVVVTQGASILQLLASEDQTLLVRRNTLLVLNLGLDILDGVRRLNIQSDGLAGQCLYEDLHTSAQTKHQVESTLLLNVVVTQCASVLQLLAREDQTLLIRWNTFLVLNLGLDVLNCVRWLDIQCDGLAGQCLYEDLHTSAQ